MRMSEATDKIFKAFAKFQGELENAVKNANNPGVKNKYADLAQCIDTAKPVLAANGLGVTQMLGSSSDGKQTLITMLTHDSGQYFSSEFPLVEAVLMGGAGKNPAQALGSAITYQRRYSFAAIIGMAQTDDDGHSVGNRPQQQQAQQPQPNSADILKSFTNVIGACTTTLACSQAKDRFFKVPTNKMTAEDNQKAKAVYETHHNDLETKGL